MIQYDPETYHHFWSLVKQLIPLRIIVWTYETKTAQFTFPQGVASSETLPLLPIQVGTVNILELPGYRNEMSPFGGIKDSGNGYKEGVIEATKSFINVKTFSLPWS